MSSNSPTIARQSPSASPARRPAVPAAAPLLIPDQAAEFLGLKPKTLAKDRCTRELGIPFIRLGRSVRYRLSDLEQFVADRVVV